MIDVDGGNSQLLSGKEAIVTLQFLQEPEESKEAWIGLS
jgi:hypothetical protein